MPAKSKSPEAAQRKVWKAEIKTLEANRRKVEKDYRVEIKKSLTAIRLTKKAHTDSQEALSRLVARQEKMQPRVYGPIDRRIALLKGRLGL